MRKYCYISVHAEWPFLSTFSCLHDIFFTYFQPDLLNFKKGWMVKLDEQGQVFLFIFTPLRIKLNFSGSCHMSRLWQSFQWKMTETLQYCEYSNKIFSKASSSRTVCLRVSIPLIVITTEDRVENFLWIFANASNILFFFVVEKILVCFDGPQSEIL